MPRTRRAIVISFLIVFGFVAGLSLSFLSQKKEITMSAAFLTGRSTDHCVQDLHYSYFSTKSFFDDAYKNAPAPDVLSTNIKGILVSHHLLAPHLIAETINTMATDQPVTVVLVSPNHFGAGQGQIISSLYKWDTPYGTLDSDCDAISALQKKGLLTIDETPFVREHGISGIVPFIKKSLPHARVIPIIVKKTLSEANRTAFVDQLYATLGSNVLVVGSFDFSHYLPDTAAEFHDEKSLSAIENFEYDRLRVLDTDSIPGLEMVLRYMEKEGADHFDVVAHTNSAEVLHDPSISETTSYIDGTFSLGQKNDNSTATILAFGDMMLDRNVRLMINEHGAEYPFTPLQRFLIGSDVVVANAEGPFTSNASVTLNIPHAPLTFTFDPATLPTLKKLGFTLFSQANNHALNFGEKGLQQSEQSIEAAGLNWFGDPLNQNLHPYSTTVHGQTITFIGYHQFVPRGISTTVEAIKAAKKDGAFVIVYPHWGIEYNKSMSSVQVADAHAFIDAGADAVLGAHPHVIEPIEIYKGKAIFYSLGNFIFDQNFSTETSQGLSVGISITPTTVSYFLFPLNIRDEQASLMSYDERVKLLNTIASESTFGAKDSIQSGIINLPRP